MSANIKIGNDTLQGVNAVELENADALGSYVKFTLGSGIEGGYTVTFVAEGNPYSVISVTAGSAIKEPIPPEVTGVVKGWSTDEAGTNLVSFPYTPTQDTTLYAKVSAVYSITGGYEHCENNNPATTVEGGTAYTATITANSLYKFGDIHTLNITMDGNDITSKVAVVSSDTISINIPNVKGDIDINCIAETKTLEESTWAEIAQVSANKQWDAMGWKVGDKKTITLNGTVGTLALDNYQCKVYILGFDHNAEKEGQGISFGMLKGMDGTQLCLVDQYYDTVTAEPMAFSMKTTRTNAGGWKASKMRKTILGSTDVENGDATPDTIASPAANTLMAAFPADLRAVLKPITKYTDNVGHESSDASAVTPTIDYLPLMAEFEVSGESKYANPNEKTYQAQYEYYKRGNSAKKYRQNNVNFGAYWYLRSPCSSNIYVFCSVIPNGTVDYISSNGSQGVAPAFLV